MTKTMKAAAWTANGRLEVVERPVPEPKPGWVRVAVRSAGICGSDLHYFGKPVPFPGQTPGHEIGGVVDAVGDGVALDVGAPVAIEGAYVCETCPSCKAGHHTHCKRLQFVGFSVAGGIAEYVLAPEAAVFAIPAPATPEVGGLVEPISICVRGTRRANVGIADRVLVLGAGTIGLCSIATAQAAGAGQVFVTARHPQQAEMARALGATGVFASSEEALKELGHSTMDVVIETVGGTATTVKDAVTMVRPLGTIGVLGVFEGDSPVPMTPVALKEITIAGAFGYARNEGAHDFAIGAALLAKRLDVLSGLVTHRFPLERVDEAFATAIDKGTGSIKVHVIPSM